MQPLKIPTDEGNTSVDGREIARSIYKNTLSSISATEFIFLRTDSLGKVAEPQNMATLEQSLGTGLSSVSAMEKLWPYPISTRMA